MSPESPSSSIGNHEMAMPTETGAEIITTEQNLNHEAQSQSVSNRFVEFLQRRKMKLAIGAVAVSSVMTLTNNPASEVIDDAIEAAPWVGSGVVASEALFIAGAGMMAASVKDKLGNPFKIKERIPEIATKARDSKLFKFGFWTNTVGAVGDFAVISAGIVAKMPPESYPLLAIPLLDLGVTVAVRKAIRSGIRENSGDNP